MTSNLVVAGSNPAGGAGHSILPRPTVSHTAPYGARAVLAAVVAIAAVIASTAIAFASTPDDTYLAALSRHGITGDPVALVGAGHDVCWALDQNWLVIGEALWKPQAEFGALGIVGPQYGQARHDAINALCPDKSTWRN